MRNIPGTTRDGTQMFLEIWTITSLRCQRNLRVEWQSNCPRSSVVQRAAFWVPCTSYMISSEHTSPGSIRTRSGDTPDFKCREPGNKWGSFPKLSSSWNGCLSESCFSTIRVRRDFPQTYKNMSWVIPATNFKVSNNAQTSERNSNLSWKKTFFCFCQLEVKWPQKWSFGICSI